MADKRSGSVDEKDEGSEPRDLIGSGSVKSISSVRMNEETGVKTKRTASSSSSDLQVKIGVKMKRMMAASKSSALQVEIEKAGVKKTRMPPSSFKAKNKVTEAVQLSVDAEMHKSEFDGALNEKKEEHLTKNEEKPKTKSSQQIVSSSRWICAETWRKKGLSAETVTLSKEIQLNYGGTSICCKKGEQVMLITTGKSKNYIQTIAGKLIAVSGDGVIFKMLTRE